MFAIPPPGVLPPFGPLTGRNALLLAAALGITACGTTYQVARPGEGHVTAARAMFAEEQSHQTSAPAMSDTAALSRHQRVLARVKPVAERFCREETVERKGFDCDVQLVVDGAARQRNAFQHYEDGKPTVTFTLPLIRDARNEDEIAFVLGHEFGHHIGQHIEKRRQQMLAGTVIMGVLTAAAQVNASNANPYRSRADDLQQMQANMALGGAVGGMAYSQTYELEADAIGTVIAERAGYDPVKGARFFARTEAAKTTDGELSFWGTHPPDEKRLSTVIATVEQVARTGGLKRRD